MTQCVGLFFLFFIVRRLNLCVPFVRLMQMSIIRTITTYLIDVIDMLFDSDFMSVGTGLILFYYTSFSLV